MREPNLREIEKKTYRSYHQDGLIDIFVGFYILLFGAGILLNTMMDFSTWFVIPAIFPAIMVPIWISFKKRITIPRIGYVKFGLRSANKLMAVILGLMVAGLGVFMVFGLGAFMGQGWASTLRNLIFPNSMIIIGVGAAIISSLFAYTMGLKRLYLYGLLTLVMFLTGHFIKIPFEYFLLTIGLAIIIYGLVLLVQFIQKYPLIQGEKTIVKESL
jgi:hypothetical protein